jgi:hypothetical protein
MLKIKKCIACAVLLLGNNVVGFAMTPDEAKAFFKEAFAHTVLNAQATKEDYSIYFSKDFVMKMDGKIYHFDDYVQAMLDLKKDETSIEIRFKDIIAESGKVATAHVTHVVKNNGEELYLNVLSLFKIQDHKFIDGQELTKLQS